MRSESLRGFGMRPSLTRRQSVELEQAYNDSTMGWRMCAESGSWSKYWSVEGIVLCMSFSGMSWHLLMVLSHKEPASTRQTNRLFAVSFLREYFGPSFLPEFTATTAICTDKRFYLDRFVAIQRYFCRLLKRQFRITTSNHRHAPK